MAVRDETLPTRLVICVDGTQYNPSAPKSSGSQTNIHRIYAGIKQGHCWDSVSGQEFNQVAQYVPGIGAADNVISTDRIQASVLGQGYLKQIQDVYESCCMLKGERDEVWLFGFSRGAYVVRAVAGLLHHFQAVASAGQPEFGKDFKKLLKESEEKGGPSSLLLSPSTSMSSAITTLPPRIAFVGAFDTVRAISDNLFDTSFNSSIRNMRHALALHEDRKALVPEYLFPDEFYKVALRDYKRSFVQAYFIGNHPDMGGAAKKAGLGLYPLQWMLLEAKECGLCMNLHGANSTASGDVHDPLSVVFPKLKKKAKDGGLWSCKTANGITVSTQDIRDVHNMVRLDESYAVKLTSKFGSMRQKKAREPFAPNGVLHGYCDWAPQGTIIHPSVYLLLDEHVNVALETKEVKLQRHLEDWRERMLGSKEGMVNPGFWSDDDEDDTTNPGAIRVLVCGNTGVGKSTLINKTFGVDVTQSNHRTRGIHDVRQEITFEGRPDLIVHDSGGFEAGADDEFQAIEAFLKEKSNAGDIMDRVHVIWFCIDINSPRTLQTATEKLFQAVSEHAAEVPIVVVATKKDDFLDIQFSAYRKQLKKEGKRFDEEACEQHAEEKLRERIETIQSEMESVPGGRLDACLAVSQDDEESISNLSKTTSHCFDTDKVRLLYIRAQVTRIDLKIDLALCEVMRRYKKLIRSATGTAYALAGPSINRKVATNAVTKAIINCFGLPTVSSDMAVAALKASVWNTTETNVILALASGLQLIGITGTVFAAGIPAWLVTGSINASYVVPATCRLFLIMACDLTFVLARSFKEVTFRANGQPNERDVSAAARNYKLRGYSQHVHHHIKKLVPRRNLAASYKVETIRQSVDDLFMKYKDKLMEDVDLPLVVKGVRIGSDLDDDDMSMSSTGDSVLFEDLKQANEVYAHYADEKAKAPMAELDASTPVAELSADFEKTAFELPATEKSMFELPAESKVSELEDNSSTGRRHELHG